MTFQFSNQVSEMASSTRDEVVKVYNFPSEGQAAGIESTFAANITDFAVRMTTDLGKTTRRALPSGNGAEKAHAALWLLCRTSSSDNLRSGFIGGKVGLDRGDAGAALLFSIGREGTGDEDLREIGVCRIVFDSVFPGDIGGGTFPLAETGINEVAVGVRLATSGRGSNIPSLIPIKTRSEDGRIEGTICSKFSKSPKKFLDIRLALNFTSSSCVDLNPEYSRISLSSLSILSPSPIALLPFPPDAYRYGR